MLDDLNYQQHQQHQQPHQQQPDPLLSASTIQVPSINDHIDEAPTFLFSVSEPEQKSEGGKLGLSYWSYRITSNTKLDQYREKTNICQRRYNDFVWLRDSLLSHYPGIIVPPLPEKTMLGTVEKFISSAVDTKSLLEYRQRALTKFLTRVGEHPILQTSTSLQQFLEMEESEFRILMKSPFSGANGNGSSGGASSGGASGSSGGSSSGGGGGGWFKKAPVVKEPEWITIEKKFVTELEVALKNLKTKLQNMITKRREMSQSIVEFGKAFRAVGDAEKTYFANSNNNNNSGNSGNNGGNSGEKNQLAQSLIDVADKSDILSKNMISQAEKETMQVIETLTYYLGVCESVKTIAKILENMRCEQEEASNACKALGTNIEKFAKMPGKEDRVQQLSQSLEEASLREQTLAQSLKVAEERFADDIKRFTAERKVDFTYMLDAFIALQIEYSSTVCHSWESLLPSVRLVTESE